MGDVLSDDAVVSLEEIPESFSARDLDLMLAYWPCIAATAWSGFLASGYGAVLVTVQPDGVEISYTMGSVCQCHPVLDGSYNATEQVVIVMEIDDETSVPIIVRGWPTPPEAYASLGAEVMGETVH